MCEKDYGELEMQGVCTLLHSIAAGFLKPSEITASRYWDAVYYGEYADVDESGHITLSNQGIALIGDNCKQCGAPLNNKYDHTNCQNADAEIHPWVANESIMRAYGYKAGPIDGAVCQLVLRTLHRAWLTGQLCHILKDVAEAITIEPGNAKHYDITSATRGLVRAAEDCDKRL